MPNAFKDVISSDMLDVMTPEELAEQRRLVQFFAAPWPMGPVIIIRHPSTPTGEPHDHIPDQDQHVPGPRPAPGAS